MKMDLRHYSILFFCVIISLFHESKSLAVMSIDLGSEWMKVGIVSPGVPMEIVLNKESKRKTPAVISYRNNERLFGEDAQNVGLRFPRNSYAYLIDLLGKDINHPVVKIYRNRFPHSNIIDDPDRGSILFKHDDDTTYSPEELIAQLLNKAKNDAENYAKQTVNECVLTVPGYFNQIERRALLQAAEMAQLKVLQLINDYTATALNYGIFRIKDFNETSQYIMLFDMGASSTTASIISFQTVKTKERGYVETHPQLSILGVGYDRSLGGLEMQLRLRDYLGKKFNEMKKTKSDVFKDARAMSKLFKEAGRLKHVLSANAEHNAQIEGLIDDKDFKLAVSREEFEKLNHDLFARVGKPIEDALKMAGLSANVLSQVILVGAGTRVPKVQEKLQKIVKQDLGKSLNTDEAAAMGAVYKAADLSNGFQVKKFLTKDGVLFPIQITFERESEGVVKHVRRTLFGLMNPYPQKKIITFNKHVDNFAFNVNYDELNHLPEHEIHNLGSLNLTEIRLEGVAAALEKAQGENLESKGIKAHFHMDESGILRLNNVELVIEKTIPVGSDEGTMSKLGSTISKFFTGDEKPVHEDPEAPQPEEIKDNKSEKVNETVANQTKEEPPKDLKPQVVTIKESIDAQELFLTIRPLNDKQLSKSIEKLEKLNKIDREVYRRATALNNLEAFVIETQNRLYEDEYSRAATETEIESIKLACSEMSDWLYDDGSDADTETYETKLHELKTLTKDWYARVFEHQESPEALKALNSMLNGSIHFLESIKNLTKTSNSDKDVFTDVEIETLQKVITETKEWKERMQSEQKKLKYSDPVVLTVKSISEKMANLDREVKYLVNKLKIWKPKKVDKPKDANKTDDTAKGKEEKTEGKDKESDEGQVESGSGEEQFHSEL